MRASAARIAHTLKGAAAQIGATQLPKLAAQFESSIGQHEPSASLLPLLQQANSLAGQLEALIRAIKVQSTSSEPNLAPLPTDPSQVREVYCKLARQLATDDMACGVTLKENAHLLRDTLGDQYIVIAEAIEDFNFSAALDCLKESAAKQGIVLE